MSARDGNLAKADALSAQALSSAPDNALVWNDRGRVLCLFGRFDEAAGAFNRAVDLDPHCADAWQNVAAVAMQLGNLRTALDALNAALRIDVRRAESWLMLGNLMVRGGQLDDAVTCYGRAAHYKPDLSRARGLMALAHLQNGRADTAKVYFKQSLALDEGQADSWIGLGRTCEDLGEAEAAADAYRQALTCQPGHCLALSMLLSVAAQVEGATSDMAQWLSAAEAIMARDTAPDEARALIGYGLAKYYDRIREYSRAARCGVKANSLRRVAAGGLDLEELRDRVSGIAMRYDRAFFKERAAFGSDFEQPVLIVGLPRSGTTLVEQIMASHGAMHGAGERPELSTFASLIVGGARKPWEAASLVTADQSRALGERYLGALRSGAVGQPLRISDKQPLNLFHLAFAALMFPNARVIWCRRRLPDNALSIWMENFNPDQNYATDFDDLAFFAEQTNTVMRHWQEVLPLPILEVQYEDTVAGLESQARRIIDFLGAPWDPACLNFHKSSRAVQTPSRWQVRQGLYSRSIERWRNYAEYLPDLAALEMQGTR